MTSRHLLVILAVVPLLVSVHARRAGADSYCDQECDREPSFGCGGNGSDDCYANCQTERDRQLSGASTPPPSSTTPPREPPPPAPAFEDDAGPAFDASLD